MYVVSHNINNCCKSCKNRIVAVTCMNHNLIWIRAPDKMGMWKQCGGGWVFFF